MSAVRRLRKKLHLVSYYSADRRRTRWSRLANAGLVGGLALGAPAMLIAEAQYERDATVREVHGILTGTDGGPLEAAVHDPVEERMWGGQTEPFGEWTVRVSDSRAGWPVPSSHRRHPPELEVNVFSETETARRGAAIEMDSPIRSAVERALLAAGEAEMVEAIRTPHHERRVVADRLWFGSIYGAGLWWVILFVTSLLLIGFARLTTGKAKVTRDVRADTRRARNRCPNCDYDLRGLEFNERCPECGVLLD